MRLHPRPGWQQDAACFDVDTEMFFDDTHAGIAEAQAVCFGCPVREDCLAAALQVPFTDDWGVWGGMPRRQRNELRKRLVAEGKLRVAEHARNNIVARGVIDNDQIVIDSATIQFYDSNGNERGRIQGVSSWVDLIDEAGVVAIRYRNGSIELRHNTNIVASDLSVGGNLSIPFGHVSADDYLASGTSDTLNRPDPSTLPAGARWYDTDDAQPIWSDGTDWRYADGTLA